jgi:hypothetical protein
LDVHLKEAVFLGDGTRGCFSGKFVGFDDYGFFDDGWKMQGAGCRSQVASGETRGGIGFLAAAFGREGI